MAEQHQLQFDVSGILTLLGGHLYSNPKVAIRELLQNAHDSCQRRLLEDPKLPKNYQPHIDVSTDALSRTLTIRDNGSGLTESEIHQYLSTVGKSYTSELRHRLSSGNSPDTELFVGQFGLGLLSAFSIASRMDMLTHSYKMGHPAWFWRFDGGEQYAVSIDERSEPGTTVILHLKLDGEFLLNPSLLAETIRHFADFIPTRITVQGSTEPLNAQRAPWHGHTTDLTAYQNFLHKRFKAKDILTLLPLKDTSTIQGEATQLRGVLYVPANAALSVKEYGDVSIYVRGMLVTEQDRELLPRWARFVHGAVESPNLNVTASREQVRQDEVFFATQQAIERQLLSHFSELAEYEPETWRGIVYEHNDLIKAWALESAALFDTVAHLVLFETTRGRIDLPTYRLHSGGNIYYFVEEIGATQEALLYEAQGLVAINASRYAEEDFLQRYALSRADVELIQLTSESDYIFMPVAPSEFERWQAIMRYYSEQGIRAKLVRFEPAAIPAVMVFPPGSDTIAKARRALEEQDIEGPVADMLSDYLQLRDPDKSATPGVLHLNVSNKLMQRLLADTGPDSRFTAALEIVYHNARFFSGQAVTPLDARLSFDMISFSLETLLLADDA